MLDGVFRGRAKSWALCEASTGTPQVAVEFEVVIPDASPVRRTWYGFLTDATFERTVESLRHCGWTGDDLSNIEGLDTNEVDLVFQIKTDDRGQREEIRWVNKVGGLAIKAAMPEEKAKSFAAQMKAKIKAMDAAKGVRKPSTTPSNGNGWSAPPAGPKNPDPPPLSDDDIPF